MGIYDGMIGYEENYVTSTNTGINLEISTYDNILIDK